MDRGEVLAQLRQQAADLLDVAPDKIIEQALWAEDLEADSLAIVELMMALEDTFDVSLPEEDLTNVHSVGEAVDLILAKKASAA